MLNARLIDNYDTGALDTAFSTNALIFHSLKWIRLLHSTQPPDLLLIGLYLDNRLVGLAPMFTRNYWIFKVAASPFIVDNTPYMGIAIDDIYLSDALSALDSYLTKKNYAFIRLIFQKDLSSITLPKGYALVNKHTHVLTLSTIDNIWNALEGRCRTAIRKAQKSGISVSVVTDGLFIDTYYDMCKRLYGAQRMSVPNTISFYHNLLTNFSNNILMLKAEMNNQCIGGAIILLTHERAYYLNGVSLHEYNKYCPNNLIQWTAIQIALERGCAFYDFVGSDIERLANFKKSYGGNLETYTCLEKSTSTITSVARARYTDFKMMMGNLKAYLDRS